MSAVRYKKTIWSELYPGNRHTVSCFKPAVLAVESSLELAEKQRKRIVWRFDGGSGSDDKIKWLISRGYHLLGKGYSGQRAVVWAKEVERWDKYRDCWLGTIESPIDFGCEVSVIVKKWLKKEKYQHSYFVSTLKLTSKRHLMSMYNARGGAEVEQFRNDKSGLYLDTRQKSSFLGQKCIVHLTDIAHNLLADFHNQALKNTRFEGYGNKRITKRLLSIPGRLVFSGGALKRIELLSTHENAKEMLNCLKKYCSNK